MKNVTHRAISMIAGLAMLVAGCANQATRDSLALLQDNCARGSDTSCSEIPALVQQADVETRLNTGTTIAVVLLAPLILLGLAAGGGGEKYTNSYTRSNGTPAHGYFHR